jgi:c-di-GMP phosphodiesterase Gmr
LTGKSSFCRDRFAGRFGENMNLPPSTSPSAGGRSAIHALFCGCAGGERCADRFIVEVTEEAFIAKNLQVLPISARCRSARRYRRFGTGYSSLSVLADITADEIKIDRSFVTNIYQRPRSQSVFKAMESVSGALGMSLVAEGVETSEELALE